MRQQPFLPGMEFTKFPQFNDKGILPSQQIETLIKCGAIQAEESISDTQVQPASLDLRLGSKAYKVCARLPTGAESSILGRLRHMNLIEEEINIDEPYLFEKKSIYVVELIENFNLSDNLSAQANPRSTTGRLNIDTKLFTDHGTNRDRIPPGYCGKLYAQITSNSFNVVLTRGSRLLQARFVRRPSTRDPRWSDKQPISDSRLRTILGSDSLTFTEDGVPTDLVREGTVWLSVNLQATNDSQIIGWMALDDAPAIIYDKVNCYHPTDYYKPIFTSKDNCIIASTNEFHILVSKERFRIPPYLAAEMEPYTHSLIDATVHEAGFFDPGFGTTNELGTPAVLEVTATKDRCPIIDGQTIARIQFYPMAAMPNKLYGNGIASAYHEQGVTLSKQFLAV